MARKFPNVFYYAFFYASSEISLTVFLLYVQTICYFLKNSIDYLYITPTAEDKTAQPNNVGRDVLRKMSVQFAFGSIRFSLVHYLPWTYLGRTLDVPWTYLGRTLDVPWTYLGRTLDVRTISDEIVRYESSAILNCNFEF